MDNMNLNKHISGQFNAELESVRNQVLVMGGLVEQQLTDAIAAIHDQDLDAARKIVANDHKVNAMEVAIDEECVRILARRQPAASDLRLVIAVTKAITDLERIGDEATKIARQAIAMNKDGLSPRGYIEVRHIGGHVSRMLQDALDAFARLHELVNSVAVPPRVRRATKPTYGSKQRRLAGKSQRSEIKASRGKGGVSE